MHDSCSRIFIPGDGLDNTGGATQLTKEEFLVLCKKFPFSAQLDEVLKTRRFGKILVLAELLRLRDFSQMFIVGCEEFGDEMIFTVARIDSKGKLIISYPNYGSLVSDFITNVLPYPVKIATYVKAHIRMGKLISQLSGPKLKPWLT